jgi:hypothetical protein
MSILAKIKFDPRRGGSTTMTLLSPAITLTQWDTSAFSVFESLDDISYTTLAPNVDWFADIHWDDQELHLHILKDYDTIVYFVITDSVSLTSFPVAFDTESVSRENIPAAWNTGTEARRNVAAGYDIEGDAAWNIPSAFYEKLPVRKNIPVAYGTSFAGISLIPLAFGTGTRESTTTTVAAWIMGLAVLPSDSVILSAGLDPGAARIKGCTAQVTLTGTDWEELD